MTICVIFHIWLLWVAGLVMKYRTYPPPSWCWCMASAPSRPPRYRYQPGEPLPNYYQSLLCSSFARVGAAAGCLIPSDDHDRHLPFCTLQGPVPAKARPCPTLLVWPLPSRNLRKPLWRRRSATSASELRSARAEILAMAQTGQNQGRRFTCQCPSQSTVIAESAAALKATRMGSAQRERQRTSRSSLSRSASRASFRLRAHTRERGNVCQCCCALVCVSVSACVCVHMCVRARVRVWVLALVLACLRACACVCVSRCHVDQHL